MRISTHLDWRSFFKQPAALLYFFASFIALIAYTPLFSHFLSIAEQRPGIPFDDPILQWLEPIDLSVVIFVLTYLPVILLIGWQARKPVVLAQMVQMYLLLLLTRTATIYFVPLEIPEGIIPLNDPILNNTIYQSENLRDLFYSGHTATVFLFAFLVPQKIARIVFFMIGSLLGLLLMWQHVHYSIDVFAAPIFAYLIFKTIKYLNNRLTSN